MEEIQVGTIILATGFQVFDAHKIPYYGYGVYPNVYTALEVERLINASGPTSGEIVLRNGQKPKTIGIIHCVGSRDENTNRWCSRVCCMYSLKLAHLIHERTEADIYNFYIDMRAPGKMMEEFYNRVAQEGIHLIRGKVADIYPDMPIRRMCGGYLTFHVRRRVSSLNAIPNLHLLTHLLTVFSSPAVVRDLRIYRILLLRPVLLHVKRWLSSTKVKLNLNRTPHMSFRRNARAAALV
jgi:hypothetical protein